MRSLKENNTKENEVCASLLFQNRNLELRAPNRNIYPDGEQKTDKLTCRFLRVQPIVGNPFPLQLNFDIGLAEQ
jgi:hypothetical protein